MDQPEISLPSARYRAFALFILTFVYTLNFLDRNLLALLLQPIKDDLKLTDTQLGLLTGIAFGLFYAVLGLPIARWADRGNRVTITSMAIGLWGITVMSCVFVRTYFQLLLTRVAAGAGESGCMPPTYSLIGDYFPMPEERVKAMTIYWLAGPIASLLSFTVGGLLSDRYGWRIAFFIIGIPGLLMAAVVKIVVSEPRLRRRQAPAREAHLPGITEVLVILWRQPTSRNLGFAYVLLLSMALGMAPWYAAFMIRNHGMRTAEVGVFLGWIFGVCGVIGILLGGYVTSRWFTDREPAQIRLSGFSLILTFPCFVLFLLLPEKHEALAALIPLVVVFSFFLGPTFALMQRLVPPDMRARSMAVVMLVANLIGLGAGPLLVGALSDLLRPRLGADSLRYAMLILSSVALWSAYHFWAASRTVKPDLAAIVEDQLHTVVSEA